MNDHAKKIWKAWVDGKTVQRRGPVTGIWHDSRPNVEFVFDQPQQRSEEWRIKPTKWFRVFYNSNYKCAEIIHEKEEILVDGISSALEDFSDFSHWLTDWIEYEAEEEE